MAAPSLQASLDAQLKPLRRGTVEEAVHTLPAKEEGSRKEIIGYLKEKYPANPTPWPPGKARAHIGVAGFFNFDIMAASRPDVAILLDNNANQRVFWSTCLQLLKDCKTSAEFRQKLSRQVSIKRVQTESGDWPEVEYVQPLKEKALGIPVFSACERLHPVLAGKNAADSAWSGSGWLKNEDAYQYIRRMAIAEKIVCASFDMIEDRDAAHALRQWMDSHSMQAQTLYVSTIYDVMRPAVNPLKNHYDGGVEAMAERMTEDEAFLKAATFSDAVSRTASRMHVLVRSFMENIRTLMSRESVCFLSEVDEARGLAVLDGEWAATYASRVRTPQRQDVPWRWTTPEERQAHSALVKRMEERAKRWAAEDSAARAPGGNGRNA